PSAGLGINENGVRDAACRYAAARLQGTRRRRGLPRSPWSRKSAIAEGTDLRLPGEGRYGRAPLDLAAIPVRNDDRRAVACIDAALSARAPEQARTRRPDFRGFCHRIVD